MTKVHESNARETGQWLNTSDGRRLWFDSGSTALDFIYTTEFPTAFGSFVCTSELGDWLCAHFPGMDSVPGERELVDASALRAAITGIAVALSRGSQPAAEDIDVVNLYAATPDIPPVLAGSTRRAGRSGIRLGQALSSMGREAIEMFSEESRDRLRECAAADCQLVFYDDSRAGSRRWCSMQRCGNRAKVRAHRARELT